jgi:hypothetical protein
MFADCREKFSRDAYPYGTQFQKHEDIPKDEINPYWDGHLKGKDRAYINGYDDATKDGINGFFSNFLAYEYELDNAFGTNLFRNVDESVLEDERDISEFSEEERAEWSKETLILKTLKDCMLDNAEATRNEIVTALIDSGDYGDTATESEEH